MAPADPHALPDFEGWETVEKLGEGGMCAVYRIRPASGEGPERAAKVLYDTTPSSIARFTAEAELLGRITHDNVLTIHQLHADDRPPWIVMDLLTGHDLEEIRDARGAMDPERAARLIADIANGLAQVHAAGVRHRDIKPANIMLGADGVARLIDFGIARQMADAHTTRQGLALGTASYLPPEIYAGDDARTVQDSERADVYALGMTLCEVLAGSPVHAFDTLEGPRLVAAILRDKLERPHLDPRTWRTQVPAGLAEVVMRATAQDPDQRTPTASALEDELRAWLQQRRAAEAAPVSRIETTGLPQPPRRTPSPAPAKPRNQTGQVVVRTGAAAASAAGITGSAGLLVLLFAVGMILLWLLRPVSPGADAAQLSALRAELLSHESALMRCAPDHAAHFALDFTIDRGEVSEVSVSPRNSETSQCLAAALEQMHFSRIRGALEVQLPLHYE